MGSGSKIVFRLGDVPCLQAPNGAMRNSILISQATCGATQVSSGIVSLRPGGASDPVRHEALEELCYIIEGGGAMVIDGENHPMGSGDLVFIPAQRTHHAVNTGPGTLTLLWSVPSRWADVPGVADAFRAWPAVEPGSSWT